MMDAAGKYAEEHLFAFGREKTNVVIFGSDGTQPRRWRNKENKLTYLGKVVKASADCHDVRHSVTVTTPTHSPYLGNITGSSSISAEHTLLIFFSAEIGDRNVKIIHHTMQSGMVPGIQTCKVATLRLAAAKN